MKSTIISKESEVWGNSPIFSAKIKRSTIPPSKVGLPSGLEGKAQLIRDKVLPDSFEHYIPVVLSVIVISETERDVPFIIYIWMEDPLPDKTLAIGETSSSWY